MTARALLAAAVTAAFAVPAPRAQALDFSLELGGGTLLPWSAPGELGNAFGGGFAFGLGDLELGAFTAVALPDSHVDARFAAVWAEARLHVLGRDRVLSPYAALGLGVATDDGLSPREAEGAAARWVTDAPSGLVTLALGLRYGGPQAPLHLSVEARAFNLTHGGVDLLVGTTF